MSMFAASSAAVLMYAVSSTTVLTVVATLVFLGCEASKNFIDSKLIQEIDFYQKQQKRIKSYHEMCFY